MVMLALLLLIVVVGVFVVRSQLTGRDQHLQTRAVQPPVPPRSELDRWVSA